MTNKLKKNANILSTILNVFIVACTLFSLAAAYASIIMPVYILGEFFSFFALKNQKKYIQNWAKAIANYIVKPISKMFETYVIYAFPTTTQRPWYITRVTAILANLANDKPQATNTQPDSNPICEDTKYQEQIPENIIFSNRKPVTKYALVIGAHTSDPNDQCRFNLFFKDRNTTWCGLPELLGEIPTNLEFLCHNDFNHNQFSEEVPSKIFDMLYCNYLDAYTKYIEQLNNFDIIMTDRALQGLIVSALACDDICKIFNINDRPKAFSLLNTGLFTNLNFEKPMHVGTIEGSIYCLLFILLARKINLGGTLRCDTQFMQQEHINLLSNFFERTEDFDFKSEANTCLEFNKVYKHNMHGEPKFISFIGRKDTHLNLDTLKSDLKKIAFDTAANNVSANKKQRI